MDCSQLTWPLSAACDSGMLDGAVWISLLIAVAVGVCLGQAHERQGNATRAERAERRTRALK